MKDADEEEIDEDLAMKEICASLNDEVNRIATNFRQDWSTSVVGEFTILKPLVSSISNTLKKLRFQVSW